MPDDRDKMAPVNDGAGDGDELDEGWDGDDGGED